MFLRTLLAAAVLLPFAAYTNALGGLRENVKPIALLAAVQVAAPFLLISAGEQDISSSLAGILVASAPIFTALLAIKLDDAERVARAGTWSGVGIGIVGVGLLLGLDTGGGSGAVVGGIFVVVASLGYAIGGFILKKRLTGVPPVGISGLTMAFSAVMTLPFVAIDPPDAMPGRGLPGRRRGAGDPRHRSGLRALLHDDRPGRPDQGLAGGLHRARLRRGLRRPAARRALHAGHRRRPAPDRGRLLPGRPGRTLATKDSPGSSAGTRAGHARGGEDGGMIDGVNVRMMRPEDRAALTRLAALDSGPIPFGAWLVAEVEGELRAALPLAGGRALADPFRPTGDLVELLQMRVAQMHADSDAGPSVRAALRWLARRGGRDGREGERASGGQPHRGIA